MDTAIGLGIKPDLIQNPQTPTGHASSIQACTFLFPGPLMTIHLFYRVAWELDGGKMAVCGLTGGAPTQYGLAYEFPFGERGSNCTVG